MGTRLQLEACEVDLRLGVVRRGGQEILLTSRERELLQYLAERAGTDVARQELLTEVWGYAPTVRTRAIDQIVRKLRDKIESHRATPRHILTVTGRGYRFEGLAAADVRYGDRFVGRSRLLAEGSLALGQPGLVLLHGPPGAGKTRLAWELFRDREGWFCQLEGARSLGDAVATVASVVGVPFDARTPLADEVGQVGRALAAGRGVLVLDNVEQLAMEEVIQTWLGSAPALAVLCTSQKRLESARILEVGGLDEGAEALFVERARQRWQAFDADAGMVAELCQRLDAMPLAIELAASRVRVLSVEGMLERLDRRLALLRTEGPARRATLEGAVAWAWDLLDPQERVALSSLCTFDASFDAAAAEAVLGDGALDAVDALVDRALIQPLRGPSALRLRVYEAVRAFVRMHLPPSDEAWKRLVTHLLDVIAPDVEPSDVPTARAALAWASGSAPERASQLLIRLLNAPSFPVPIPERLGLVRQIQTVAAPGSDADGLVAHEVQLLMLQGRIAQAEAVARRGLERVTTTVGRVAVGNMLAYVVGRDRPDEALALLDTVLHHAAAGGHPQFSALRNQAGLLLQVGRREDAVEALRLGLENARARDVDEEVGNALLQMAQVCSTYDLDAALDYLDQAARAFEAARDAEGGALVAFSRANAALMEGRLEDARAGNEHMAAHARRIEHGEWLLGTQIIAAWIALDAGAVDSAIAQFAALSPETHANVAHGLAMALLLDGRHADAARWLEVPSDCIGWCLRAVALDEPGALAQAAALADSDTQRALVRVVRQGRADPEAVQLAKRSPDLRQLLRVRRRRGPLTPQE